MRIKELALIQTIVAIMVVAVVSGVGVAISVGAVALMVTMLWSHLSD